MATTKVVSVKYLDLISVSADETKKEELVFANEDAKIHVSTAILETQKKLAKAKRDLTIAMKANPYSLQKELDATFLVSDTEIALAMAKEILDTRF